MLRPVARKLAGRARRVFFDAIGTGTLGGSEHFEAVVAHEASFADPGPEASEELARASCVVSVMNIPITWHAHDRGIPAVLIDGLGWMWREPVGGAHRGGVHAKAPAPSLARYFVERFVGVDEKMASWVDVLPPYEVVGPFIDVGDASWTPGGPLLVNVGGMDSWLMPEQARRDYVSMVARAVLKMTEDGATPVQFAGGQRAMELVREEVAAAGREDCSAEPLEHDAFVEALRGCLGFVTAAGMRALLEAFAVGVPVAFLPPQNVSQELVLHLLEDLSLAPGDASWRTVVGIPDVSGMSGPEGCAIVNGAVSATACDTGAVVILAERLARDLADMGVVPWRQEFVRSLGPNGAERVSEFVAEVARLG